MSVLCPYFLEGCLLFPLAPFDTTHAIRPRVASNFFLMSRNHNPSGLYFIIYLQLYRITLSDADDPILAEALLKYHREG
jgi:hypothetical protein